MPKPHGGGVRTLGIRMIVDRAAQKVVARRLEAPVDVMKSAALFLAQEQDA